MNVSDLLEIEAIKRLKYAYMRCLDQKRFDEIGDLFTDDATAAYSGGKYEYHGRDAIVGFLRRTMSAETFLSSHRVHQPEIDLTGATTATGTWAMDDVVVETAWQITIRGAAFYEDEYEKVDGRWRIKRTGYRRSYEEIQPRADVPGLRLTASWWATGGQSELEA
jgi:hypothetical protein